MAVFRVEKNANYTTMCNYHLRDQTLSLKAKGLLSMLLSLPDTWHYSVRGLAAISLEGVDGILTALKIGNTWLSGTPSASSAERSLGTNGVCDF